MTRIAVLVLAVCGLALAGCGASSSNSTATTVASGGHPAGATPSVSSQMICSKEAQTDIAASLGVKATVSKPTWINHVYACQYKYPNGVISMSVQELDNKAETLATFNAFATKLGRRSTAVTFGDGAFLTTNGSVIVHKDFKVLDVDVSKLPEQFGNPLQDRSNVALSVAANVMSCWTGS